jgi:hemoglobin-like flavoprotein
MEPDQVGFFRGILLLLLHKARLFGLNAQKMFNAQPMRLCVKREVARGHSSLDINDNDYRLIIQALLSALLKKLDQCGWP